MLDELERLLSAATPGPIDVTRFLGAWRGSPRDNFGFEYFDTGDGPRSEEDARLIAAAVNALPALLRVARAVREVEAAKAAKAAAVNLPAALRGEPQAMEINTARFQAMIVADQRIARANVEYRAALAALEAADA